MHPLFELTEETPSKPARAVVLGANGFIGGAILRALRDAGVEAAALGRPALDLLRPDATAQLADALRDGDALVLVSAKAPCRNSEMLLENLAMARAVCAALQRRSVAHVVYVSSDAVYKDAARPLSEASCAEPGSLHGAMHLAREIALRSEFAGPLAIVRPTLVYGFDDPHNGYGPNRFRRLAAAGKEIVLFGEGEERRDHVDVEDVAALVVRALLHRAVGVANAVSGEVVSFRELAEFVASEFSPRVAVKGSPRSGPMPHNGFRPFERSAAERVFSGFRFRSWREGLSRLHARQRSA
jgi:nucleoside-diphosphate-sugar epimerase